MITMNHKRYSISLKESISWFIRIKDLCQYCVRQFFFWFLVAIFTLVEPLLCARKNTRDLITAQAIVLAVSSLLYCVQLIGVATREWEKIMMIEAMANFKTINIQISFKDLSMLKLFVFFTAEGEYILEGAMLLAGWILIFFHPGLAILRCFRVFRLLW